MELIKTKVVNEGYEQEINIVFNYNGKQYGLSVCLCGDESIDEAFMVSLNEKREDEMFYEKDYMMISID